MNSAVHIPRIQQLVLSWWSLACRDCLMVKPGMVSGQGNTRKPVARAMNRFFYRSGSRSVLQKDGALSLVASVMSAPPRNGPHAMGNSFRRSRNDDHGVATGFAALALGPGITRCASVSSCTGIPG
jgi:hypothetical protein